MEENEEEDLNRLAYLQAAYTQQYELLTQELATYTLAKESLSRSIEMLENSKNIENSKILVNNGAIFFEAKTEKIDKVLVYVGAGYSVEKSIEEAKSILDKMLNENNEIIKKLNQEKDEVDKALMRINYSITALQARSQG